MSKKDEINTIYNLVKYCKKCSLYKNRTDIVFGEGSLNAEVMFMCEALGYYEDIKDRPFVGMAGKILDDLFNSIKLKRNKVYITNVLIYRPTKIEIL